MCIRYLGGTAVLTDIAEPEDEPEYWFNFSAALRISLAIWSSEPGNQAVVAMPFTPTHVLAVLPVAAIRRLPFPFSALVIGSMIPDLPPFVPLVPGYETTHSVPGLVTACLPVGLACFLLFERGMKRPLLALLPAVLRLRCATLVPRRPVLRPGSIAWASLAVVVGAATHLFWDSFTHQGRWGTLLFPSLNETALVIGRHAVPGFKVLQYGSTLIGLPCLMLLLAVWLYRQPPSPVDGEPALDSASRITVCLVGLAVPILAGILWPDRRYLTNYGRLGDSITNSGLALMIVTLVYCLVYNAIGARFLGGGRVR